ncbi:MFS transporter [Salinispora arenicola]|uniref:MFS transporter n=1 Tax=Salinispora arenicola TaxID=168697 RepID=UPI0016959B61|nr:MFS transporter [Salinispora arenicola]NIL57568.1 MFS transporter [Salinispora arenicola]NIL63446.1 MFS transporter [Salinispora arenicola]
MSRSNAPAAAARARPWRILNIALIVSFISWIDLGAITVMLPSIDRALGTDNNVLQWVVSGYSLMFALALVPAGRLGDAKGRRYALLLGLTLFVGASTMAGLANSGSVLVAARLLQGAAAGILSPQIAALVEELFRPSERGRPFGAVGATSHAATAVGPLIGGMVIAVGGADNGWRLVFLVNAPIGIAAAVLIWRYFPKKPARDQTDHQHDLIGTLLLAIGIVLVILPALQQGQWTGLLPWLLVPVGIGVLVAFRSWETSTLRRHPPVFDFRLLTHRTYRRGLLLGFLYFAGFTSLPLIFSFHLQFGLHRSPLHTGLTIAPLAIGSVLGAVLGGRNVDRYGRPLLAIGLAIVMASLTMMMALTGLHGTAFSIANGILLLLAGIGSGLVITPNNTLTLQQVPRADAGSAAGMYRAIRQVGSAIGLTMITATLLAAVAANDGRWPTALRYALAVEIGIVAAALLTSLVDILGSRRHGRNRAPPQSRPRPGRRLSR